MEKTSHKTIELSQEELHVVAGGSLTEAAYKVWEFIGFCCTLDTRARIINENYNTQLAVKGY